MIFKPIEKQEQFINAILSRKYLEILYGGAMGGGKTIIEIAMAVLLSKLFPKSKWVLSRKDRPVIERNLYPSWEELEPSFSNFIKEDCRKNQINPRVIFKNQSEVIFYPENFEKDKELNRLRGFNVNGFFFDEVNEQHKETYDMAKSRIGRNQVEKNYPKFLASSCNPTRNWVKKYWYEPWKENRLPSHMCYIQATMHDNPYVKHLIEDQRKIMSRYAFDVYVNGNWDIQLKVGNEYWRSFEIEKHIDNVFYDDKLPIHISIDNNVLPYIAITIWQIDEDDEFKHIKQIDEILVRDPDNTATGAAKKIKQYLKSIDYDNIVFLYGDATAKAKNTIDPQKRSFVDLLTKEIENSYVVDNRIGRVNPNVALRGEFINAIYEGIIPNAWITINEDCKESIGDYIEVKTDLNGGMVKKKVTQNNSTYEDFGHLSDTKAYFLCTILMQEFNSFKNKSNYAYKIIKKSYNYKL